MPYSVHTTKKCPAEKPYGLFKKKTGELVSCHVSANKAWGSAMIRMRESGEETKGGNESRG